MKRKLNISPGFWFVLPWIIGFVFFFLQPIVQLIQMSFSEFTLTADGMKLLPLENRWEHFTNAVRVDANFPVFLTASLTSLLTVPIIVFLSLISGIILSQKFKGRTAMRVIFFLPMIISAGVIVSVIQSDVSVVDTSSSGTASLFDATSLMNIMLEAGLPQKIVDFMGVLVTNIANLVWKSTIQTFVFLIALLAIPQSHYEVAQIEGATAWETFWKLTFPISLPYVLVNTIYTIIDGFASFDNKVIQYITDTATKSIQYDYAAAMSWIFFIIMGVILALVALAFKPFMKKIG